MISLLSTCIFMNKTITCYMFHIFHIYIGKPYVCTDLNCRLSTQKKRAYFIFFDSQINVYSHNYQLFDAQVGCIIG